MKALTTKERAMHHSTPLSRPRTAALALAVCAILLAAAPSPAQSPDLTSEQLAMAKADSRQIPQVATIQVVRKAEASSAAAPRPSARRQAPNPKLAEASCTGLGVAAGAPGVLVFDDGFEGGDLGSWQPSANRFSARATLDLELTAELQGLRGEALMRIELTSPGGHAHQTLEAPVVVAASASEAPQNRLVDGYPHPVPVRFAVPGGGGSGSRTVSMVWPLAGTHVVSHGLYGVWTAHASLVDTASPGGVTVVCPARTFTLSP